MFRLGGKHHIFLDVVDCFFEDVVNDSVPNLRWEFKESKWFWWIFGPGWVKNEESDFVTQSLRGGGPLGAYPTD